MNINIPKNTYRCNFCDDGSKGSKSSGGMLDLYANVLGGMNLSEAYREICEQLGVAGYSSGQQRTPRGRAAPNLLLPVLPADAEPSA